ncbi:hypothetical protein [Synechococcus sp. PCC 6312]|uniref:hypothetical protein n=1 Tax=Synechococcus sp. (strain ATCC 27167 / PCC 6312) TaxID=195253 RepID=UPI00029ED131|nr:hypothetical protein [Synechococcus sp. PCC 6312]AFY60849.1 hypothetical protein Syn6312_1693 [Synechococcus sp. PCC 6312]
MTTKITGEVEYKIPITGEAGAVPTAFTISVNDQKLTLPNQWLLSQEQVESLKNATKIETSNTHGQLDLNIKKVKVYQQNIYFSGVGTWTGNEEIIYSSIGELSFIYYKSTVVKGMYLRNGEELELEKYLIRKRCFSRLFGFDIEDSLTYGGQVKTRELLKVAIEKTDDYAPLCLDEEDLKKKMEHWIKENQKTVNDIALNIQSRKLMEKMEQREWPPEIDEAAAKVNQWMIQSKGISLQEYLYLI